MNRVAYLVPEDRIGGVEIALRSLSEGQHGNIAFHKFFLARHPTREGNAHCHYGRHTSVNHPLNYIEAIVSLRRLRPDTLVASLWRSCLVLVILKLLHPNMKGVVFLHSTYSVHALDRFSNWLGMIVSHEIWVDCVATLESRVPKKQRRKARIISFVIERAPPPPNRHPEPSFIFWGRLHKQKRLDRSLRLFASIRKKFPSARYTVIGPDGGELDRLEKLCNALGLKDSVAFLGPMTFDQIRGVAKGHALYLQTSDAEGMAMSVVEAMQLGLIPVVTPVGEIARYCEDLKNSIIVTADEGDAVERVSNVLQNRAIFEKMSRASWETWNDQPLYRDDVLAACRELMGCRAACGS